MAAEADSPPPSPSAPVPVAGSTAGVTGRRFQCTPAGAIAAGRRRIRRTLVGAAAAMLALAVAVLIAGRWGPALIAAGVAALALFAWRMSGDLDPLWLTLEGDQLKVQMRRQHATLALRNPSARRLDGDERSSLRALASASGVVFASASYESRALGEFDLYATDLERAVVIEVDAPPGSPEGVERVRWIVTPDEPDALLAALAGHSSPVA